MPGSDGSGGAGNVSGRVHGWVLRHTVCGRLHRWIDVPSLFVACPDEMECLVECHGGSSCQSAEGVCSETGPCTVPAPEGQEMS